MAASTGIAVLAGLSDHAGPTVISGGAALPELPRLARQVTGPSGERWRAWPHAGASCPSGGGRFG